MRGTKRKIGEDPVTASSSESHGSGTASKPVGKVVEDITAGLIVHAWAALRHLKDKEIMPKQEGPFLVIAKPPEDSLYKEDAFIRLLSIAWVPRRTSKSRVIVNINASSDETLGQSILFIAAALSQRGDHRLLSKILRHWSFLNPDVNNAASVGDNRGLTVLWYATRLADMGEWKLLNAILDKWTQLSPIPNLDATPLAGIHKGITLQKQAEALSKNFDRGGRLLEKFPPAPPPAPPRPQPLGEFPFEDLDLSDEAIAGLGL